MSLDRPVSDGTARPISKDERARSFGAAAAAYAAHRPAYPVEAVRWAVPDSARHVVDLAAGTGKFTRLLMREGRNVIAVEPSGPMRAELARYVPGAEVLEGSADRIPLADASVDALVAAQAWHWFDPLTASQEIARVLRPGGTVTILWNVMDESVPWVAQYGQLIRTAETLGTLWSVPQLTDEFTALEHRSLPWVDHVPRSRLRDLARTRSNVITLPEPERAEIDARIDALIAQTPELTAHADVALPYTVEAWRSERIA